MPSDSVKNALFPWLALGYTRVITGGQESKRCAFFPLTISLNAAMTELGIAPNPHVVISPPFLASILRMQAYKDLVEIDMTGMRSLLYADQRALSEVRAQYTRQTNLDRLALKTLMQYLRLKHALDFDLGIITQGFWCRYDERLKVWDYNYQQPMSAQIENDDRTATNRPVIWIWNDNNQARYQAHDDAFQTLNHWEGFAGPTFAMPAARAAARRARVQGWDLGTDMRQDIANGVWRMTADQEGPSEDGTLRQDSLAVKCGAFVREALPWEGLVVPEGSRYMQNMGIREARTPGDDTGLVPNALLIKIDLHPNAPGDPVDDPQPPATRAEKEATMAYLENMEATMETEGETHRPGTANSLWRIYRVVEGTNKAGGPINADHPVNNLSDPPFAFRNGDFMLDTGLRDENGKIRVISIDRREGSIHPRRLQLLEEPWVLPPGTKDVSLLKFHLDWTTKQLEIWAWKVKIPLPKRLWREKQQLIDTLDKWRADNIVSLPLYRLTRSYTAEETGDPDDGNPVITDTPAFLQGEIVSPLVSQDAKYRIHYMEKVPAEKDKPRKNPKIRVVDFEGLMGYISLDDLEELPDLPFGIELLRSSVPADADCDAAPQSFALSPPDRIKEKRRAEEEEGREAKRLKTATAVDTPTPGARRSALRSILEPRRRPPWRRVAFDAESPPMRRKKKAERRKEAEKSKKPPPRGPRK